MDNSVLPPKIPRILSSSSSAISNSIFNICNDTIFDHDLNASIKKELKKEPSEIKQEVDLKDAKILQLQEENISLKMEKNDYERIIKEIEAINWQLRSSQTNQTLLLELNNQGLETDLALHDEKVTNLTKEIKKLKSESEKLALEKAKYINDYNAVKTALEEKSKKLSDLEKANITILGDNAEFSVNNDQLKNDYQNILREKEDMEKRVDEMASLNAHLEERNKKLTDGNQELSEFFTKLTKTLPKVMDMVRKKHEDKLAAHLLQESLKVTDLEKEKSDKEAEIESLKKDLHEIEEIRRNQENKVNSLENDLKICHTRYKNLLFEARCINQKKEGLEQSVKQLEFDLNNSQNVVASKNIQLADLNKEAESRKNQCNQLVGNRNSLINNFNHFKKEHENCAQLASNCQKLQDAVKVLRQNNNDIKAKLALFEKASSLAFGISH